MGQRRQFRRRDRRKEVIHGKKEQELGDSKETANPVGSVQPDNGKEKYGGDQQSREDRQKGHQPIFSHE